jgi:hypothetical protein
MKIVDRKTFLSLPKGTVYVKAAYGHISSEICVKESEPSHFKDDWYYSELAGDIDKEGMPDYNARTTWAIDSDSDFKFDTDVISRDGYFDEDQKFAIYDMEDIEQVINKLQELINK